MAKDPSNSQPPVRRRPKRKVIRVPSDVVPDRGPREITLDQFNDILVELRGHVVRPERERLSTAAVKRPYRNRKA